jgi:hypothetical protein
MPTPRRASSYPLEIRDSLNYVLTSGSLFIPCEKPAALRLQYYGYFAALRESETPGESEFPDNFSIFIKKAPTSGILITLKEASAVAKTIRDALNSAKGGVTPHDPLAFLDNLPDPSDEQNAPI